MKTKTKKLLASICLVVLIVIAIIGFLLSMVNLSYNGRVFPRIYLGETALAGLTHEDLASQIQALEEQFGEKIILTSQGKSWTIDVKDIDLKIDQSATTARAYAWGRHPNFIVSLYEQIFLIAAPHRSPAIFSFDKDKLAQEIVRLAAELDRPEKDASLTIEGGEIIEHKEEFGQRLEQLALSQLILSSIQNLDNTVIELPVTILNPQVYSAGLVLAQQKTEKLIRNDFYLQGAEEEYQITKDQIGQWLDFYAQGPILEVRLNQDKIKAYLASLAQKIDQEPVNAQLTIIDGRVTVFARSQDGLKLEQDKALKVIEQAFLKRDENKIKLPIVKREPEVSDRAIDDLGIKELVGRATTSFKNSPANRIHNIQNGTKVLTGSLIKPGEEFSVVEKLGKVDNQSGYLPELVIKENRTIPEYGGGLCQVSTTLFRAALDTGLPILERTNHSYRVSYYEPPIGLDATVYLPKPDLKFKNDTQGYLLIQSKIEDTNLTFEFYGTSDGRTHKVEGPFTSNYTNPPDPIRVETDTLMAGEEKQIERAHKGATSVAYYKVYNKDGSLRHEQTFQSKYKAWAARFLVGTRQPDQQ